MTADKDTGLPELPGKFFWRIQDQFYMNSFGVKVPALTVQICSKSRFRTHVIMEDDLTETDTGHSPPGEGWVRFEHYYFRRALPPTTENVQDCADKLYKKFTKWLEDIRKALLESEARQKLVGTYPPKKLNY